MWLSLRDISSLPTPALAFLPRSPTAVSPQHGRASHRPWGSQVPPAFSREESGGIVPTGITHTRTHQTCLAAWPRLPPSQRPLPALSMPKPKAAGLTTHTSPHSFCVPCMQITCEQDFQRKYWLYSNPPSEPALLTEGLRMRAVSDETMKCLSSQSTAPSTGCFLCRPWRNPGWVTKPHSPGPPRMELPCG